MKKILTLFVALFATGSLFAQTLDTVNIGGLRYEISTISPFKATVLDTVPAYSGKITIPETITALGHTYTVDSIGKNAFKNCTNLQSIAFSDSLTGIGDSAFFGCTKLTSLSMDSVSTIGASAFEGCTGIKTITFVKPAAPSVGADAFKDVKPDIVNVPATPSSVIGSYKSTFGTYPDIVSKLVASITTGAELESLFSGLTADIDTTISLSADIDIDTTMIMKAADAKVTIIGNGYTISAKDFAQHEDTTSFFMLTGKNANLTLNNIVLDGNGKAESAISADTASVKATLTNGATIKNFSGYGVSLTNSTFESTNSTIDSNHGGIYASNAKVDITGGTISNNQVDSVGGGIHAVNNSKVDIDGATLTGNSAGFGGGAIYAAAAYENNDIETTVNVKNSKLTNNSSNGNGGVLFATVNAVINIDDSELSGNKATNGGALCATNGADVIVNNGWFKENSATQGACVYLLGASTYMTLNNCTVEYNDEGTSTNVLGMTANDGHLIINGGKFPDKTEPDPVRRALTFANTANATLANTDGAIGAGIHYVNSGNTYTFTITPNTDYSLDYLKVTTEDAIYDESMTLVKNSDGSVTVTIPNVQKDMTITISGISHVANVEVESANNVWGANGTLYVEVSAPANLKVYTITGAMAYQAKVSVGTTTVSLSKGLYLVKINDVVKKVVIK